MNILKAYVTLKTKSMAIIEVSTRQVILKQLLFLIFRKKVETYIYTDHENSGYLNLSNTRINSDLIPSSDADHNLGSGSANCAWNKLYIKELRSYNSTYSIYSYSSILPTTNTVFSLGSSESIWSSVHTNKLYAYYSSSYYGAVQAESSTGAYLYNYINGSSYKAYFPQLSGRLVVSDSSSDYFMPKLQKATNTNSSAPLNWAGVIGMYTGVAGNTDTLTKSVYSGYCDLANYSSVIFIRWGLFTNTPHTTTTISYDKSMYGYDTGGRQRYPYTYNIQVILTDGNNMSQTSQYRNSYKVTGTTAYGFTYYDDNDESGSIRYIAIGRGA